MPKDRSREKDRAKQVHKVKNIKYERISASISESPTLSDTPKLGKKVQYAEEDSILLDQEGRQRHQYIKNEMKQQKLRKIPDPQLFSTKYREEDHKDLIEAFQLILQNNSQHQQQENQQLFQQLLKQVQELNNTNESHQALLQQLQTQINDLAVKQSDDSPINTQEQLKSLIKQYNDTLNSLQKIIQQQSSDQQTLQNRIEEQGAFQKLQQKLQSEQQNLKQQFGSISIDELIAKQCKTLQLYQFFTGIQLSPGIGASQLLKGQQFVQQLDSELKADQQDLQYYYVFRNQLDKTNYQALLAMRNDDAEMANRSCSLRTAQVPQNVIQEQSVLEMFKGETETQAAYLRLIFKQLCVEFTKYDLQE